MPRIQVEFSPEFEDDLDRLERKFTGTLAEVEKLVHELEQGNTPGDRIQSVGKPVYKVRLPNRAAKRGKSGGFRAIYYVQQGDLIWLVTIYSKTEKSDVSALELRQIIDKLKP